MEFRFAIMAALHRWYLERVEAMSDKPLAILYVEDNLDNRILVQRVLQAAGYAFMGASSAPEGLMLAREHHPDLILVDINMPEVDGLSMTRELKSDARFRDVPVIAITANVMRGDRERTLAAGCDGYIQKPVDVDLLPRQIVRFLHREI
jgi:two-component system cell cycle response regulator DivK